ncbi:MAG: hypothetical protein KF893_06110 [Caldilineaceae bacterium]|nr:hypothetical protein [Caldilineaceae bacterium]
MDAELIKIVYAAVRERWEEDETPFDGHFVHDLLDDAGIQVSRTQMDQPWSYLEDLGAIEIGDHDDDGAPFIESVDTEWSAPHTNVTRI